MGEPVRGLGPCPVKGRLTSLDRQILALAIPALGALAIDPLLSLADTAFVARLGTLELAALGVDTTILNFAFFGFNFLAAVVTPLVAKALAGGKVAEARRWVGDALLLALGLGVLVTGILLVFAPVFVDWMGAGAEAEAAVSYLRIRALATPAVLIVTTGHGAFRGHKDTRTPLKVAFGVNLINLVLDPILIFGAGWGLEGAAIATVIAQIVGAVWFLDLLRRRDMAARPTGFVSAIPSLVALGKNGALLSVRTGLLLAAFTIAASTATRLGSVEIAAHQLVMQIFLLTALMADSLAIAAQALVGEATAEGTLDEVNHLSRRLVGWGVISGVILGIFVGVGRYALQLLASEPAVADVAVEAGLVVALLEPLAAVLFVLDGIFLGLLALGTMALSTGVAAVIAAWLMLATSAGESVVGIWWALGIFFLVRGLVFVLGYKRAASTAVRS